eukprot:m.94134 g.94134  ORF g.94134 m.94134 type:complete len:821 (-) comp10035_c4_seq1:7-2469(-)
MISCLEKATLNARKPGCRILNATGPTSYTKEPVADVLRAWYGDHASRIQGLSYFETPGRERAPLYDLTATETELNWTPTIDLNQDIALSHAPVFLVIGMTVPPANQAAWMSMASELIRESRAESGCIYYDFIKMDSDGTSTDGTNDASASATTTNNHRFVIVERWASESHLAAHSASVHFNKLVPRMNSLATTVSFEKGRDALLGTVPPLPRAGAGRPDDAVYLVIHKTVTADQRTSWLAMASELSTATRQEDGCLFYDYVAVDNQPETIVIVECWASDAHLSAHAASAHFTRLVPLADAMSTTAQFDKGTAIVPTGPGSQQPVDALARELHVLSCKPRVGKILVFYDSATSCTRKMAALIRDGALQLDRTEVRLRKVGGPANPWDHARQLEDDTPEVTFADVLWADGIACGTPCNLGGISWRMKKFWDDFSQSGGWSTTDGKIACAFASQGGSGGGAELACMAMNEVMLNFGFSTFGVTDYVTFMDTLHYGATVAKAPRDAIARMGCRRLGLRLAEFVGLYIMGRPETHPLLASKRRDVAQYGFAGIPARGTDLEQLEAFELAGQYPQARALPTALIFTKMAAYVHDSTPAAASRVASLAERRGYKAVVSSDASLLEQPHVVWDVIVLVNNSGDCFDLTKETLTAHVAAGRGVMGVHAALASFLDGEDAVGATPLGAKTSLISDVFGAHFVNHPLPQKGTVVVDVAALRTAFGGALSESPAATLDATIVDHYDEFFNFDRALPDDVTVLARADEGTYEGGTMGKDHPLVWCRHKGKAPIFYCGIGHFDALYEPDSVVSKFLETGFNFCAPDPLAVSLKN